MRSFSTWGEFPNIECFFDAHSALGVKPTNLSASEHQVFSDLALVLAMIPDLSRWSKEEKSVIRQIVRAKAGTDELRYVRLLQNHQKLRDALRTIGSRSLDAFQERGREDDVVPSGRASVSHGLVIATFL